MDDHRIPSRYAPLSAWAYFGLSVLYAIPIIGFIFLIIHTFSSGNINRRSFARSYWCRLLLVLIIVGLLYGFAVATGRSEEFQNAIEQSIQQQVPSITGITGSTGSTNTLPGIPKSSYDSYSSIYTDYAQRLTNATPGLIAEYKQEAASNTNGIVGLAEISNAKIQKLALISNEGVEQMANYMFTQGSGSYDDYQNWAMQLNQVYMTEAQKITDVYMSSAAGSLGG